MDRRRQRRMDSTDKKILNILQGNARISMKELGTLVGLTSPAVTERVRRLEEEGIIEGYRTIIKRGRIQKGMAAFINMEIPSSSWQKLARYCEDSPYVLELYHTIGVYGTLIICPILFLAGWLLSYNISKSIWGNPHVFCSRHKIILPI